MRRFLAGIYAASAGLAGIFLVGVLGMILAGILGRAFGFYIPGTDAYAGYCMAASSFLALAPTLRHGGHIRVEILLQKLPEKRRRSWERVCGLIAFAITAFLAYFSIRFAWQSYLFHDISQGSDATPLWIPQIAMALGSVTLAIACFEVFFIPAAKPAESAERSGEPTVVD